MEFKKTDSLIEKIISKKVKLFRPPYGVTNPRIRKAVDIMDYDVVGWSLKSKDSVIKDEKIMLKRLKYNLKPGSVVLFHDTHKRTIFVVREFVEFALSNNYKIIRVDKLLKIQDYGA